METNKGVEVSTKSVEVIRLLDANKARVAFLAPVIVAVLGAVASWVTTGNFSDSEIRTAVSGAVLGFASGVSTYFTGVSRAEVKQ